MTLRGKGGIEPFETAAETARVRGRKFKRYTSSTRQSSEHGKTPVAPAEEGEELALQREAAESPSVEAKADSQNSESAFSFGMKKASDQNSPVPSVSFGPRQHTPTSPTPNADRRVLNDIYQELNTLKNQVQGSFPIMSKLSAYLESHEAEGRVQSGTPQGSESAHDVPLRPSLEPKSHSRFQDTATSPKRPRGSFKQPAETPAFATPVSSPSPNNETVPSISGYNGDRVKAMMAKLKAEKFKPRHGIFAPDIDIEPLPTGDTDTAEVEEERKDTQRAIETLQEPFEKIMSQIEYQHSLSSSRQPLNFDDPISNEDIERVLAEVSTIILEEPPSPAVKLPKGSVHPKYEDIQEKKAAERAAPEPASPSSSASSSVIHAYVDAEASDIASVDPARVPEVRGCGNDSGACLNPAVSEEEAIGAPKSTDTDSHEDKAAKDGAAGDEAAKSGSTDGRAGTQRLMRSDCAGPTGGGGPAWFKDPFSMVFRILKMDGDSAQKAFRIASCGRSFLYRNDVTSIYALLLDKITLQQLAYIDLLWETYMVAGNLSVDEEISIELFMQVTRDAHFARSAEHIPSGTLLSALQRASDLRSEVAKEIENLGAKPDSMPIKTCMNALLNLAGGTVSSCEACFVLTKLHRAAGCDTEGFMDLESLVAAVQLGPGSDDQDVGVESDTRNEEVQREASALAIQGAFRSWLRDSKYSEPPAAPEACDSGETGPVTGISTASREDGAGAQPDSVGEDQSCPAPEPKSVFESSPQLEGTFKPRPNQPRDAPDLLSEAGEEARAQQLNQTSAEPASATLEESRIKLPVVEHDRWSSASFLEQYVEVEAERKAAEDRASRRNKRAHDKHAASVRLSAAQRAARAAEARVIASQKKLQEAKRKEMALLAKDVAKALGEVDKIAKDMEFEAIETNRMMQAYDEERKKRNQDYMGVIAKQIKALEGRIEDEVREEASAFL